MPHSNHFDVIVIAVAPEAKGQRWINQSRVERCNHWKKRAALVVVVPRGTIPSKALRHAVSRIIEFNNNPLFCQNNKSIHSTFSNILGHAKSVIDKQTRLRQGF